MPRSNPGVLWTLGYPPRPGAAPVKHHDPSAESAEVGGCGQPGGSSADDGGVEEVRHLFWVGFPAVLASPYRQRSRRTEPDMMSAKVLAIVIGQAAKRIP